MRIEITGFEELHLETYWHFASEIQKELMMRNAYSPKPLTKNTQCFIPKICWSRRHIWVHSYIVLAYLNVCSFTNNDSNYICMF